MVHKKSAEILLFHASCQHKRKHKTDHTHETLMGEKMNHFISIGRQESNISTQTTTNSNNQNI